MLATLGSQNRILADLTVNADKVVGDLAANRKDVGRFVTEAKQTAQASAERRGDIAAGLRELPGFLEQLQPTMKALGQVADDQGSALRNLDASSQQLTTFFDQLGPVRRRLAAGLQLAGQRLEDGRSGGQGGAAGHRAARRLQRRHPRAEQEPAIVLQHLDDRKHAVEKDPRSPGGQGYTGLEALLQYVYDQTTSTSIFDQNNHILKVGAFVGPCADYASEETLKKDPSLERQCGSRLGPIQPGLNYPDVDQARDARRGRPTAGRASAPTATPACRCPPSRRRRPARRRRRRPPRPRRRRCRAALRRQRSRRRRARAAADRPAAPARRRRRHDPAAASPLPPLPKLSAKTQRPAGPDPAPRLPAAP